MGRPECGAHRALCTQECTNAVVSGLEGRLGTTRAVTGRDGGVSSGGPEEVWVKLRSVHGYILPTWVPTYTCVCPN